MFPLGQEQKCSTYFTASPLSVTPGLSYATVIHKMMMKYRFDYFIFLQTVTLRKKYKAIWSKRRKI